MSIHTPRMFKHDHIFHEREQETILNTYIDTLAEWWENAALRAELHTAKDHLRQAMIELRGEDRDV